MVHCRTISRESTCILTRQHDTKFHRQSRCGCTLRSVSHDTGFCPTAWRIVCYILFYSLVTCYEVINCATSNGEIRKVKRRSLSANATRCIAPRRITGKCCCWRIDEKKWEKYRFQPSPPPARDVEEFRCEVNHQAPLIIINCNSLRGGAVERARRSLPDAIFVKGVSIGRREREMRGRGCEGRKKEMEKEGNYFTQ